jgi:hypothetical protein
VVTPLSIGSQPVYPLAVRRQRLVGRVDVPDADRRSRHGHTERATHGYGWLLMPFVATTVLSMSGASPPGVAVLTVVPNDFAFVALGNDSRTPRHNTVQLVLHRCSLVACRVLGGGSRSRTVACPIWCRWVS